MYFPHSAGSSMLPNLSQSIFTRGYTPVTVSSTGEALIQSRQAKFAVVILPESEVELLKKVRCVDNGSLGRLADQNVLFFIYFYFLPQLYSIM